jgi:hypothetical protein
MTTEKARYSKVMDFKGLESHVKGKLHDYRYDSFTDIKKVSRVNYEVWVTMKHTGESLKFLDVVLFNPDAELRGLYYMVEYEMPFK